MFWLGIAMVTHILVVVAMVTYTQWSGYYIILFVVMATVAKSQILKETLKYPGFVCFLYILLAKDY